LRVDQVGGSADDFSVQLEIDFGSRYLTDTVGVASTTDALVLDFGQQTISAPSKIRTDEYVTSPTITIRASNTNASPGDLDFIDLVLIPVDEFAVDAIIAEAALAKTLSADRYLDVDSVTYPFAYIRTLLRETEAIEGNNQEAIVETWITIANNQAILQNNTDQRLWFLHLFDAGSGQYSASLKVCTSVQAWRNQRYFSYRGDQ